MVYSAGQENPKAYKLGDNFHLKLKLTQHMHLYVNF